MATHDYVIANGTGAAVRSDLNNALAAIVSNNSSSSEPGTTYAYQWWADTNANVLKLRNSSNDGWVTLRELDGTMLIEDGSAASPGLSFASDLDTGFFRSASNRLNIATGGTERLEIGSSEAVFNEPSDDYDFRVESNNSPHMLFVDAGNDRVGIATSSPNFKLDVNGEIGITEGQRLSFHNGEGSRSASIFGSSGDALVFANTSSNTERMRIDSSGRLLLGTTSSEAFNGTPSTLQIEGASDATTRISLYRTANDNGSSVLVFAKARNTAHAQLQDDDTIGKIEWYGADGNDTNQRAAIIAAEVDGAPTGNDMPGRIVFSTTPDGTATPVERMRINANGSIFFGRTNSTIDNSNHGMVFHDSNRLDLGRNVSATGSVFQAFGGNGQFRIMGDGDAENTNNRYTGISDIKYKQNVQNASSQWDDIKAIQVRKYELIANPGVKHIGVVAQELEQICPGLVIERTVDEETGETAKSVAYSVLYMKAVKALQEAMERIETLEAKVAALEAS